MHPCDLQTPVSIHSVTRHTAVAYMASNHMFDIPEGTLLWGCVADRSIGSNLIDSKTGGVSRAGYMDNHTTNTPKDDSELLITRY